MWFLQADKLLLMLGVSLLLGILGRIFKGHTQDVLRLTLLADLAVLWYISEKLTVFYAGYTLVTYLMLVILNKAEAKGRRRLLFGLFCFASMIPMLYSRTSLPSMGLEFIGAAFAMLRAIDAVYYTYFGEELPDLEIYCNYMLFFPVMTAGPVFRYRDFKRNWDKPHMLTGERLTEAVLRIIRGLFKKVVLAMLIGKILSHLTPIDNIAVSYVAVPLVSLAELYFDMAGYADIAIGMGALIGWTVPENFKKPFSAPSLTQEWRNWHVSVSDWIREHIYVLLNGKKLSKWENAGLAVVVMMLMALWQSFSKPFIIYGLVMGILLALENIFEITNLAKGKCSGLYYRLRIALTIYVFSLCCMVVTV